MSFAAVVFLLGCLFFGTAMFYLGSVMNKVRKMSGGYSARKLMAYSRGLRTVAKDLREAAKVGDSTALATLSLIESIEDEVSKLDVEFEDRAKKESGTK